MQQQIQIYQDPNGQIQIEVQFEEETIWLNRQQIALLFSRDVKTEGSISIMFSKKES